MAGNSHTLRTYFINSLPKASSSSSIADMRVNESQKLRVLVASNGAKDVAQALALVVRLSKNPKIETRAIVDEEAWPAHRLSQETLALLAELNEPPDELQLTPDGSFVVADTARGCFASHRPHNQQRLRQKGQIHW